MFRSAVYLCRSVQEMVPPIFSEYYPGTQGGFKRAKLGKHLIHNPHHLTQAL